MAKFRTPNGDLVEAVQLPKNTRVAGEKVEAGSWAITADDGFTFTLSDHDFRLMCEAVDAQAIALMESPTVPQRLVD